MDTVIEVQTPMAELEEFTGSNKSTAVLQSKPLPDQRVLSIRHQRPSGRVAWAVSWSS